MAKFVRARGFLNDWLGEDPVEFGAQGLGGGTAAILVGWVKDFIPAEWAWSDEVVQAIAGAALARAGTYYGQRLIRAYGTGVLKQLVFRIVSEYVHGGGSIVVKTPKQVAAAAPMQPRAPMDIRAMAEREANIPRSVR